MTRPADGWLFVFRRGCGRPCLWIHGCGAGRLGKSAAVKTSTRHRLGYFRTHYRGGGSDPTPPIAISRSNGRIEPREAAFESSPRDPFNAYLRF